MSTKFGLVLSNRNVVIAGDTTENLLTLAEAADQAGLDDVWVGDSLGAKPRVESITLAGAVAARTSRVRIGPACMATTPLRDPLLLAYQWCSLDQLANGRTVFVACQGQARPGNWAQEYEAFKLDPATRTRRMVETIEILRSVSREEHVTYAGEFHQFEDLTVLPRPVQQPIPIWIASSPSLNHPRNVETAYRRVATMADGWMTIGKTAQDIARSLEFIRAYADEAGRRLPTDFEACLYLNMNVNGDVDAAFEESTRFMSAYYDARFSRETLERTGAIGPADACIQRIHELIDAGVTTFAIRFMSFEQKSQLERFLTKVLPIIR